MPAIYEDLLHAHMLSCLDMHARMLQPAHSKRMCNVPCVLEVIE